MIRWLALAAAVVATALVLSTLLVNTNRRCAHRGGVLVVGAVPFHPYVCAAKP